MKTMRISLQSMAASISLIALWLTSVAFGEYGQWIEQRSFAPVCACGEDCMGCCTGTCSSMLFFDIHKSAWSELHFDSEQTIQEVQADGHVFFAFSDELLIGYSSLLSTWDTVQYSGTLLHDTWYNQSYGCGKHLAFFVTEQRMYVFDAALGYWQEYDYGLPAEYVSAAWYFVKDDYVQAVIGRTYEGQPKDVVYSLHTHSFNQLEYGCHPPSPVLDHGFARAWYEHPPYCEVS